jgi:hypothetical protein
MWNQDSRNAVCVHIYIFSFAHRIYFWIRLALQYQVWNGSPHLILEESQILENKCIKLQTLIDMFQHQADSFILQNKAMHDLPISPLLDYEGYDHVDDMNDSRNLDPTAGASHTSRRDDSNAKDTPILLPSTLGMNWCTDHGIKSIAIKESKLCFAQANDSIDKIRLALKFKASLFCTQVRPSTTKKKKT